MGLASSSWPLPEPTRPRARRLRASRAARHDRLAGRAPGRRPGLRRRRVRRGRAALRHRPHPRRGEDRLAHRPERPGDAATTRRRAASPQVMSRKGIARDTTVVIYGDKNNWWAAYALWVFTLFGHEDVRLLDGGRAKWVAEGRELTTRRAAAATAPTTPSSSATTRRSARSRTTCSAHLGPAAGRRALARRVQRRAARTCPTTPQEGALRGGHIPAREACRGPGPPTRTAPSSPAPSSRRSTAASRA